MSEHEELLRELASAYGVATDYWDWQGRHDAVATETMVAVLAALDVDAADEDAARQALADRDLVAWRRMLPPVLVTREGWRPTVDVHVPDGWPVEVWVELETGERRGGVDQHENWNPARTVDDELVGEATFAVPGDLPLGYHWLHAHSGDRYARMPLVVTPHHVGLPPRLGDRQHWGVATQLYSARSSRSWGTGDLVDLLDLGAAVAVDHRAAYVLVNPLHAAEPTAPMEPSPYLPTSRRYGNPLYVRPERIPEYVDLTAEQRDRVEELRLEAVAANAERIDRDAAWAAKREALRMIYEVERTMGRRCELGAFEIREGNHLTAYATWNAIAEVHGPDWTTWPEGLAHPVPESGRLLQRGTLEPFRREHRDLVDFHAWLQWVLDEQLAHTQLGLRRAGMGLGVMTDLAVGVNPKGADTWALRDVYAQGVYVGAPPDPYNQQGQDWTQPPWRPDRLAEAAYEPVRHVVQAALRHAGGLRVDHVIGLFRLWWIPQGAGPTAGTYVRYDHEAMIGILALEAVRADAVVVGEDLGTVEPWVRQYLADRGILGTSILWFEMDHSANGGGGGSPLPAERWRASCLASVTTHDLPPTAGYLAGDHVRLRESLGLLTQPLDEELASDALERQAWLAELRRVGLLAADENGEQAVVEALHAYLGRTPSRLRCLALTDAAGDRRTQNQPGTIDEYPNWRVPLSGPDGRPVTIEDVIRTDPAQRLFRIMAGGAADPTGAEGLAPPEFFEDFLATPVDTGDSSL
jgi:4-alpha-glucanotransferase